MITKIMLLLVLFFQFNAPARTRPEGPLEKIVKAAGEALTTAPKDGEVCFSPDEACDAKLWKFIQTTQKTVDVAVFDITHPKIVHEILVASRKYTVRIVVDRRQAKGDHSLVSTLVKGGATVRFGKQRGIMHDKFTIVDGKRLETGSYNYTNNASQNNQENQIYLADPEVLKRYQERFEKMWREGKPVTDASLARG